IVSSTFGISQPDDAGEIVLTRWLFLNVDLPATTLYGEGYVNPTVWQRVIKVCLRIVIRVAANSLEISCVPTKDDSYVIVNAPFPRYASASSLTLIWIAAPTP